MSTVEDPLPSQEGSKFKRFLKRFGRRPSDEHRKGGYSQAETDGVDEEADEEAQRASTSGNGGAEIGGTTTTGPKKVGSMRGRKSSKSGGNGLNSNSVNNASTKGKKNDSIAGRFFQSSNNAPPVLTSPSQQKNSFAANGSAVSNSNKSVASPILAISAEKGFGGSSGEGLANTLTIPPSPAPQLEGLPQHEPIATSDVITQAKPGVEATPSSDGVVDGSSSTAGGERSNVLDDETHLCGYGSDTSRSGRGPSSVDVDSTNGGIRGRDSLDNRTMDTGKSRASTKPTTLMSIETPDNTNGSYTPMAQIAQFRHGDPPPATSTRVASTRSNNNENYGTSIQFAPPPPLGRTVSGTIVQLPGSVEEAPYVNVPSVSRPHPSNNPMPAGLPADNASTLTLASSTAAASITDGAASSRGHSHAAPSLGGARSIGGSYIGDRRNSYDTYASVKAIPPLSRRGSDSSTRTGKSVAASATGRSSAQAMMTPGSATFVMAGPGAPSDRISLHRTPSQRTVATQLSIPISSSNQAMNNNHPEGGITAPQTVASESIHSILPSITTTAPHQATTAADELQMGSSEIVQAHADQLAAAAA